MNDTEVVAPAIVHEQQQVAFARPDYAAFGHCIHVAPDLSGHCPECGKCLDHRACSIALDLMDRYEHPDSNFGPALLKPFRERIAPLVVPLLGIVP